MRKVTKISQLPQNVQKEIAQKKSMEALLKKHKGKKISQLTKADIDEWICQKMAGDLGLEA